MRSTDVGTVEQICIIAESIPSSKVAPFIQWIERTENQLLSNPYQLIGVGNEQVSGEIVLYQADDSVNLEVRLENETVWLTQAQIVELFQSSKGNISEHIANIFEQEELEEGATVRDFRTVQSEGGRTVTRTLTYYNLDVIISVGFRVNAKRGVRFRQWANRVLREHLLRGYTVNQQLLQLGYNGEYTRELKIVEKFGCMGKVLYLCKQNRTTSRKSLYECNKRRQYSVDVLTFAR